MATLEPMSHEKRLTIQAEAAARVVRAFRKALGDSWSEVETADRIAEAFADQLTEGRFCGRLFETTERQPIDATCCPATNVHVCNLRPSGCVGPQYDGRCPVTGVGVA